MRTSLRTPLSALAGCVATAVVLAGAGPALATPPTCTGTREAPGSLIGTFPSNVSIQGTCAVDGGKALIRGNLTITPGSTLVAAFALNHLTGTGSSGLTVFGNVNVRAGATLIMGCSATSDTPCFDDPAGSTRPNVFGSLIGNEARSIVVHNAQIRGNVTQSGGGGGATCEPEGEEAFSAYEETIVNGNVNVNTLQSCWLGLARLRVAGNVRIANNTLADPDAIEILSNTINGTLNCSGNSMVWNSSEKVFGQKKLYPRTPHPNTVIGRRLGECVLASPETEGGPPGPGPF